MNRLDLEGRHAVVTGGASGIGLAIAQRLADSGGRVTIWDIDAKAGEKAAAGLTGQFVAADKTDRHQQENRDRVVELFRNLDPAMNDFAENPEHEAQGDGR